MLPGSKPSAVQLEAYKKLCIAEVMASGAEASLELPSAANPAVSKLIASGAAAHYKTLAADVAKGALPARVAETMSKYGAAFDTDGNAGLVIELAGVGDRLRLRKLTRVYASLPLAEAARLAGLSSAAEAARMLGAMVR